MLYGKYLLRELSVVLLMLLSFSTFSYSANFTLKTKANDSSGISSKENQNDIINTKKIIATGLGLSEEKALKNAFKSAIQQFVGVVVDSEIQLKNGKIIKDNIFTASNGFIQEYDILSVNNKDGLFEIEIKAIVKSQKLFDTIKSLNIATISIANSSNIQARVETKSLAKKDAGVILKKTFDKLLGPKSLKEIIALTIKNVVVLEDQEKDGNVPVEITYEIGVDYKIYSQKIKHLEKTFENLGAKLHKRLDFPFFDKDNKFWCQNKDKMRKLKYNQFFIVKKYAQGYKTDMWTFPVNFKSLYPFYKTITSSQFSRGGYFGCPHVLDDQLQLLLEISNDNGEIFFADKISTDNYNNPFKNNRILRSFIKGDWYNPGWVIHSISGYFYRGLLPFIEGSGRWYERRKIIIKISIPVLEISNIKNISIILE